MLEGITILAEGTKHFIKHNYALMEIGIIIFLIGFIIMVNCMFFDTSTWIIIAAIIVFIVGVIIAYVGEATSSVQSEKTYPVYKVLVDDSVPLNAFYEKYEIISQEGQIFEIKEKK